MSSLRSAPRNAAFALALVAAFAAGCGPRDVQAPGALEGRWQGHVAWHDATTPIVLVVSRDGDSLAARVLAPALADDSLEAGRFAYDAPRVHFAVPDSAGAIAFDGWLRRGLVVGAFSGGALGAESNRTLLPQLSLKRIETRRRTAPWPDSLNAAPVIAREPQHSLGAWLAAHAF